MNSKLMPLRRWWRIFVLVAAVLLVLGAWPMRYLASPGWEVWVVNDHRQPIPHINVRLTYQNYSAEDRSHDLIQETNENGHALFPARYERANTFQYVFYTVSSARAGVHADFGRHAYVFASGGGYAGYALTGNDVADWQGSPDSMQSRIVVRHIQM